MTMKPQDYQAIPAETKRVAHQAFPQGNRYVQLRDRLGVIYQDAQFQELFCAQSGQRAYSPGQLALVTVMQYVEGLSDRQAAEALRSRIDWKYMLGLELTDTGFDYSVLSEFRGRLIDGKQEMHLLDELLRVCQTQKLVQARGQQRTDSTHVVSAVRQLNRLEFVGETLRQGLEVLAQVVPDWLLLQVDESWWERYGVRVESAKLVKSKAARTALVLQIGQDGHDLLAALDGSEHAAYLAMLPALQKLRQVWWQQYTVQDGQVQVRGVKDLPPFSQLIQSPYERSSNILCQG
jgi:transposase